MLDKEKFKDKFGDYWKYAEPHFHLLTPVYQRLKEDSKKGRTICPKSEDVYRIFRETPLPLLKVVIIGYDPYSWVKDAIPVADGLAFSCSYHNKLQPSLEKIYEGVESDLGGPVERCQDLKYLAQQGVLLLNSALTVEKGKVGSHTELWQPFMKKFLEEMSYYNTGIIYWIMGADAKKLQGSINTLGNYLFYTEHPAAAEHQQRDWVHKNSFTKINNLLIANHSDKFAILWDKKKYDEYLKEEVPF